MTPLKTIRIDYDYVSVAFGYVLTTLREERNLSEDDFARSIGVDPAHYRGLESGAYGPSLHFILRLAVALDCHPEELIAATTLRLAMLDREKRAADEAWTARLNPKG